MKFIGEKQLLTQVQNFQDSLVRGMRTLFGILW
jgi:hypothetical protein